MDEEMRRALEANKEQGWRAVPEVAVYRAFDEDYRRGEAVMDKRLLDVADWARQQRLAQISAPIPPQPAPECTFPDGRIFRYVGPWNPNEAEEARQREVEELATRPLLWLIANNAAVSGWYHAYWCLYQNEGEEAVRR